MATTVPAAVPEPDDGPAKGGLIASALAPVTPARPTFDLAPATAADPAIETPVTGLSSASYRNAENAQTAQNSTTAGTGKKGIWRAWLLAGAARWAKGGGAYNKRLEVAKMRAQARQVKESRQVSVNRSDGLPGRGLNSAAGGGKSPDSKSNGNGPAKDQRNSNGNPHNKPSARTNSGSGNGASGGASRNSGASRTHGGGSGGSGTRKDHSNTPSRSPKGHGGSGSTTPPKDTSKGRHSGPDAPKSGTGNSRTSGGGNGSQGPAGSPGKSVGTGSTRNGGGDKGTDAGSGKGADKVNLDKPNKTKNRDRDQTPTKGTDKKAAKDHPTTGPSDSGASKDKPQTTGSSTTPGKVPNAEKTKKDPKPANGQKGDAPTKSPLQESRETGYRDGTRAAKAAAHVKAYRDGVKDGYADATAAAKTEKARLDKAREDRKKQLQQQQEDKPVTAPATSADHQPQTPTQPIEVKGIDADNLQLGDGAARQDISRGEVRSLKNFERRLDTKSRNMTRVVEGSKHLKAQAEGYAKEAGRLLEAAQTMHAGEKLTACLTKLHESANIQAGKAEAIQTRATRAAEACKVLLANVETRYGGMYKAVVDSDEKDPADLDFYKD